VTTAAGRWRERLQALRIPPEIVASAPTSPYGFSVELFSRLADEAVAAPLNPSARRAAEALPRQGELLDVGCGAGAASLPLAGRAGLVVGVDESPVLLAAFAERAEAAGVDHIAIEGRWPDVADRAPAADVVVCRHVVYNVPDLAPFLVRLTDHARIRVVVHLPLAHPLAWMVPYWQRLHGYDMPAGPTADDFAAVAAEAGMEAEVERWNEPFLHDRGGVDELVDFLRRRLCLPADRDGDLRRALDDIGLPRVRPVVTAWWEGAAR
jgi:SAM-dependent methyltransferase